jgi:alginate O-acetyltransferase complex protein AlgI
LTLTGYVFYSFWNYKFCALMLASTLASYFAGRGLLRWGDPARRKICLVLPVTLDLLLLGFFKYANFFLGSVHSAATWANVEMRFPVFRIILPVGISFYTFHTITYIVDGYRGVIKPTRNFLEFSCYVSLFAQLVAGPIVRFRQIEYDIEHIAEADRAAHLNIGWSFFVIGLVKKVLIADTIAAVINPALGSLGTFTTADAWLCALGYTYQIYFDFSGYSDMAVGLGHLFGLRLPQNFNSPYKAADPSDFWRRWHMSLSTMLRDYLYIPMGGGRVRLLTVCRNLMITMLLGGLWHGANWTFVVWGGYHGLLLVFLRVRRTWWERVAGGFRRPLTFLLVMLGWVLFRSDNFRMALLWLRQMFSWRPGLSLSGSGALLLSLVVAASVAHVAPNTFEIKHEWKPLAQLGWAAMLVACVFFIAAGQQSPFLYFQF